MIEQQRINLLMTRKVAGEASLEELAELDELLLQYPELQYTYTIVADIREVKETGGFSAAEEQQLLKEGLANMDRLMAVTEERPVKRLFSWKMSAGIAACIAVLVAVYGIWKMPRQGSYGNEIVTKNGSKTAVILPDGTSVVLNACSRLKYDVNKFLNGNREVVLTGEAYFDVKHDPQHPFIIQTAHASIKVLGTVFNVKAYAEDATVETTLLSGKVEVSFREGAAGKVNKVVVLEPEQKLIIDKQHMNAAAQSSRNDTIHTFAITPLKVNNQGDSSKQQETAWMNDRFEFDNVTLEQLSHDLERWYNVTIRFKNDKYKYEVFTGAFRKQRIEQVLQALQLMSADMHYEVNSKENVIYIW